MERYVVRCEEVGDDGVMHFVLAQSSNSKATAKAMARQFHSMTWLRYIVVDLDSGDKLYDTLDEPYDR